VEATLSAVSDALGEQAAREGQEGHEEEQQEVDPQQPHIPWWRCSLIAVWASQIAPTVEQLTTYAR